MARGGRGGGGGRGRGSIRGGGGGASSSSIGRGAAIAGASSSRPRPSRRACHANARSNMVSFACQSTNSTEIQDEIDFMVHHQDDGLCISVGYKQNVNDTNATTNANFDVCVDSLIEYRKSNVTTVNATEGDDEAYDWENDQVLQTMNLSDWDSFSDIVTDDKNVSSFSASTMDDLVTLTFAMSPSEARHRLTPNNIKLDVRILNFPWQLNDSYVALLSRVQSKRAFATTDRRSTKAKKPKNITVSFADVTETARYSMLGEFTWADNALVTFDTVENETIPVVATSPPEQAYNGSHPIAFSFVGDSAHSASDILWDPEVGVGYASSTMTSGVAAVSWSVPFVSVFLVGATVLGVTIN